MSTKRLPCLLLCVLGALGIHSMPLIGQEQCLIKAWSAAKTGNYDATIQAADDCINNFAGEARNAENEQRNLPVIKPGSLSPADRNRVVSQGILNDVAAAYIAKGEAAEALARSHAANAALQKAYNDLAVDAYEAALALRHALVSNGRPPESFWSPCRAAANHLQTLTKTDRSPACR